MRYAKIDDYKHIQAALDKMAGADLSKIGLDATFADAVAERILLVAKVDRGFGSFSGEDAEPARAAISKAVTEALENALSRIWADGLEAQRKAVEDAKREAREEALRILEETK